MWESLSEKPSTQPKVANQHKKNWEEMLHDSTVLYAVSQICTIWQTLGKVAWYLKDQESWVMQQPHLNVVLQSGWKPTFLRVQN